MSDIFFYCLPADNDDDGFNLIQPSLIQQLRTILDQYPDDGQILKVRMAAIRNLQFAAPVQSETNWIPASHFKNVIVN